MSSTTAIKSDRDPALLDTAAVYFTVTIATLGAILMSVTSSPTAKGASFLWFPAALQLIAGIWLGKWRGLIVGGLGAYLAGIICYGGWGLRDIIMNLIAGGVTNAFLPSVLFTLFHIDPTMGTTDDLDGSKGEPHLTIRGWRLFMVLCIVFIIAYIMNKFHMGLWGYIGPFAVLLIAPSLLLNMSVRSRRDFVLASIIVTFASLCSALLGSWGQVFTLHQSWPQALLGTGIGWFLGNTTSCILGLYILAAFTTTAREGGISLA